MSENTPEKITVALARTADTVGREVLLQGWVRTRRDSKAGFSFIELNDGSSLGGIQIIADKELENYESEIKHLTAGCSISIVGLVKESPGKGQATEVQAKSLTLHAARPTRKRIPYRKNAIRSSSCARSPIFVRARIHSGRLPAYETVPAARSTISSKRKAFSTCIRR